MTADPEWLAREEVIGRFEARWRGGEPPRIGDFLPPDGPDRFPLLLELVKVDLEYRWERGEERRVEDYAAEHPDLAGPVRALGELLAAEVAVRRRRGCPPSPDELIERFGDRAAALDRPDGPRPPGRLGRYHLRGVLGRGSFSTVYRAWDPELCREVAVKEPRPELLTDPGGRERILREARGAARLRHPGIVPLHEAGDDGGRLYLVYDLIPGPTLAARLREGRPAARQAAEWAARLAEALDAAHRVGLVHRDVKPSNILLDADGNPVLTDFGLALLVDERATLTQTGEVLGTPAYMPPEQAAGHAHGADARSDVYSLGVVLFEMLCGRVPFQGSPSSVLNQLLNHDPPPPGRLAPGVPRDLETVCLRALAREPSRRYPSAGAMAADLRRFLNHEPIRARRPGPVARFALWVRRNPGVAATLAASGLVVLAVAGVAFARVLNERDRYRAEREQAVANLYRSRVGEARALRLGRTNGYRVQAWDRLRQAAELDTPARDLDELREEAVASLGDFVGQEPAVWEKPDPGRYLVAVAIDAEAGEAVFGVGGERNGEGRLLVRRLLDGGVVANWAAHPRGVFAVAAGPGGRLVSADEAGRVKVWKRSGPAAWDCVRELSLTPSDRPNHVGAVTLSLSPDGRDLVGCSRGATEVRRWNLDAGGEPTLIPGPPGEKLLSAAVSPDGRWIAAGVAGAADYRVRVWDARTGKSLPPVTPGLGVVEGVTFSADGRYLAVACGEGVAAFTAPEFRPRFVVRGDSLYAAAFSPSGRWLAIPAPELGTTRVWDVAVNREVAVLKHPDEPHTTAFHPDGGSLVITSANATQSWNLRGVGERTVLAGHQAAVTAVSFTRDGTGLASAGADRTVRLWDPGTGRQRRVLDGFGGAVLGVAFAPDGRHVAIVEEGRGVRLWDVGAVPARELAAPAARAGAYPEAVAWASDGRHLAASGLGGVTLWPRAGAGPAAFGPPGALTAINSDRVAFSPDGLHLSWVQNNSIVCIRNLDGGATHRRSVKNVDSGRLGGTAFFPDSRLLVMGEHAEAEVWDAAGKEKVDSLGVIVPAERVNWYQGRLVAVDPAAALVAVQYRDTHVWDVGRRRLLFRLPREHAAATCLACSPTAGQLVIGSADGGLVAWDLDRVRAELDRIGLGW